MQDFPLAAVVERLDVIEALLPGLERRLLHMQHSDLQIESKTRAVDLVTSADYASEQRLVECIRGAFPADGIVAEEGSQGSEAARRRARFRWVIDPIDGTVNYANRMPGWAISIGLLWDGVVVGGIVAAPALGERFRAIRGAGATLNSRPIRVNTKCQLGEGLVATGFPYNRASLAGPLSAALQNMLRESGGVRRLGAAALDFCYVADGRFVGYYEMGLKPWDAAAGSLIALEAGAQLSDLHGQRYDLFAQQGVVVSNARVHRALLHAAAPLLDALEPPR